MDEKELFEEVKCAMENEGFDYCFRFYSNFSDIKDEKFQKLREQYVKITNELEQYVNSKIKD